MSLLKAPPNRSTSKSQTKTTVSLTIPSRWDLSPRFESDKISESKELKRWVDNYLGMGEWVMDQSVAILGSTGYFERKR